MNRRNTLKGLLLLAAPAGLAGAAGAPIVLALDLEVQPGQEKELEGTFAKVFRPAISKQPGFVEVKLLRLRSALAGKAPAGCGYRLLISFQTEEQRQKWVATDAHQQAWPQMEKHLKGAKYVALLYDGV